MTTEQQLTIKINGWLEPRENIRFKPSPNFDERPNNEDPSLLVIHNISLPPNQFNGDAVTDFFQNKLDYSLDPWLENIRDVKVSAHFFIRRTGQIIQLVATDKRAWHAGISSFNGRTRCNDFSIGIELEGSDFVAYENQQYHSLQKLIDAICERHKITAIQGHEHIAPGRKTDPGPYFEWHRIGINL